MGKYALKVGGTLIGVYLFAAYASNWGKLFIDAGKAGSSVAKTLQGRG
jgi:hypothetical protein